MTDARSDRLPLRSRLFPSDMGCIPAGLGSDGIHLDESADGFTKDRRLCFNVCGVLPFVSLITDARLLDTVVLDAIPGPEHLAMANSLTFSMAVSHPTGGLVLTHQSIARAIGPFIIR